MKRLVIKLVSLEKIQETEEHEDGTKTITERLKERDNAIVETNYDISEFLDSNSAYNVISRLAGKMIELEILKQQVVVTEAQEEICTMTQSEVEDIFNDMIEDCYIDNVEFSANINRC